MDNLKIEAPDLANVQIKLEEIEDYPAIDLDTAKHSSECGVNETRDIKFECAFCSLKTARPKLYAKHMVSEHCDQHLQCSNCFLQFVTEVSFLEHAKTFHKNVKRTKVEGEIYPCMECSKVFSKPSNLESHKRAVHNIHVQVCEFCCKEFKNKDYCRQHIRLVHESHFQDKEICDVCSKVFKNKSNLYHHKRAVHEVAEDLICYICASKCKNSFALRKHVRKCQVKAKQEPKTYVLGCAGLLIKSFTNIKICRLQLKFHLGEVL